MGEYIFKTGITLDALEEVEGSMRASNKNVSKKVVKYNVVELNSNKSLKKTDERYSAEVFNMMTKCLDACQAVEGKDNLHFIRNYLTIAAICRAAIMGSISVYHI